MNLWEDSSFKNEYDAKELTASQLAFVKIDLDSLGSEQKYQVRPIRCWQTLSPDGAARNRYKSIVSNG